MHACDPTDKIKFNFDFFKCIMIWEYAFFLVPTYPINYKYSKCYF